MGHMERGEGRLRTGRCIAQAYDIQVSGEGGLTRRGECEGLDAVLQVCCRLGY